MRTMRNTPDQQISLIDPDARSMATSGRGSGVVGYNVQVAVDTATSSDCYARGHKRRPTTAARRSYPFAHNQDPERTYRDHRFQRGKKALSAMREIVNQTPAAAFISPASSS